MCVWRGESLSSRSSMAAVELQSGSRSQKKRVIVFRVTKQCGWGGGNEFTTVRRLHTFRIGIVWSQKYQGCVNEAWKLKLRDLQKASFIFFRFVEIMGNHLHSRCSRLLPQLFLASSPPLVLDLLVLSFVLWWCVCCLFVGGFFVFFYWTGRASSVRQGPRLPVPALGCSPSGSLPLSPLDVHRSVSPGALRGFIHIQKPGGKTTAVNTVRLSDGRRRDVGGSGGDKGVSVTARLAPASPSSGPVPPIPRLWRVKPDGAAHRRPAASPALFGVRVRKGLKVEGWPRHYASC